MMEDIIRKMGGGNSNSSCYGISLLVYEMSSRKMEEALEKFYIDGGYSCLDSAKSKVKEVEKILKGDNPILYKGISRKIDYPSCGGKNSGGFFGFGGSSFRDLLRGRNHLSSVFTEVSSRTLHSDSEEKKNLPFHYSSGSSSFSQNFASSSSEFFKYSGVSHLLTSKYRGFLNTDPDDFIRPLDIIKTSKDEAIHTGIYLGKGKVSHNFGNGIEIID
jgi:hypothetical protein